MKVYTFEASGPALLPETGWKTPSGPRIGFGHELPTEGYWKVDDRFILNSTLYFCIEEGTPGLWNPAYVGNLNTALVTATGGGSASLADWMALGTVKANDTTVRATAGHEHVSLKNRFNQVLSVFDFIPVSLHAGIQASTDASDLSVYLQNAIDAAAGKTLDFPRGKFTFATTLVFKNNTIYRGAGKTGVIGAGGTLLWYIGFQDAIQINNPPNTFTRADILIKDMGIFSQGFVANKATLVDTGSSFLTLDNVAFGNNWYGLVLDQTEHFIARGCDFSSGWGAATVWIVNGPDRTIGHVEGMTNQLAFYSCSFGGVATYGVADDGGISHAFYGCEFTGSNTNSFRIAGGQNIVIEGTEDEGAVGGSVLFAATRLNGTASYMPTMSASIRGNFFFGSGAFYFVNAQAGSIVYLKLDHNVFAVAPGGPKPIDRTNFNVIEAVGNISYVAANGIIVGTNNFSPTYTEDYIGYNNTQAGSGITNTGGVITYFGSNTLPPWTPLITTSGTPFVLGNGVRKSHWSRNGNLIMCSYSLVLGSTTTIGTGNWSINLPFNEQLGMPWVGLARFNHAGAIYRGICRLPPNGTSIQMWGADGAATPVGQLVPFAWAAADELTFTITYNVLSK